VHVVDDDHAVCTSISKVLGRAGIETRCHGSSAEFLLAARDNKPGCIVLDVALPGLNGFDLQAILANVGDRRPVVFITGRGDIRMTVRAMKAGAVDFLSKPFTRDQLLAAVHAALERDSFSRAESAKEDSVRARFNSLTPRQRDVFAGIIRGRLNKQIADAMGTTVRTVKAHRAEVMRRMGVDSLAELLRAATKLGEPPPE
jgi:FixJ family two-component response regulator